MYLVVAGIPVEVDEDEETIKIVQLVKSQDTLREENINLPAATSHKVGNQSTHLSQLPINQPTSHSCLSINPHTVANQLTSHCCQSINPPHTVDIQLPVNQSTAHTVANQSTHLSHSCQSINPPLTQLPINQSTSHSGHTVACQSIHRTHSCQSINLPHTKLAINQPTSHSCLSSVNQSTAHTVANQLTSHRWQSISPPRTVDTQVPVNQFTAHGGHTVASQSIPLKLWTHSCQSISPPHTVATESIHLAQCTQLLINQSASHSCQTIHLIQLLINQSTSQSCQSINPPHTLHYRYVPYGL